MDDIKNNKVEIKYPAEPILMVDDEIHLLNSFDLTLAENGMDNTILCNDSKKVLGILSEQKVSLILLDLSMPDIRGEELLEKISPEFPEIPVIVVTGDTEIETAVHCMKLGAFDYITKPVEPNRLISQIKRALELSELKKQNSLLSDRIFSDNLENPKAFDEIITQNAKMKSMFQYMEAIAGTREPIRITGETGVGKELIAKALHKLSKRTGRFVTTNIAGLDDQMFSDSLFGHKKGAFTNASQDRKGYLEMAVGGTIFLDEIGDLNPQSQVKLLRLLQEKEYYPLGSDDPRFTDALIIVATNRNLQEMVQEGEFRKDLYYRLNVHKVTPLALIDRLDDLPLLVDHFLELASMDLNKPKPTTPPELITLLSTYSFPGNIRELQSMIYDAVSTHKSKIMSLSVFKKHIAEHGSTELLENNIEKTIDKVVFGNQLPTLKEVQNNLVNEALKRSNNNQSIAANLLGVTRQALNKRIGLLKDKL